MNKVVFEAYTRPSGHNEFAEFAQTIPPKDREKLYAIVSRTQKYGLLIAQRQEWVKKLDKNLYELRSKSSGNIQRALYFHSEKGRYIITHGSTKKSAKTPKSQIEHAKTIKKEFYDHE